MRHNDLAEAIGSRPFKPFRVHVSGGATFEIRHPEFAWLRRHYLLVLTPERIGPEHLIERDERIDLMHITRIEMIDPNADAETNNADAGANPENS